MFPLQESRHAFKSWYHSRSRSCLTRRLCQIEPHQALFCPSMGTSTQKPDHLNPCRGYATALCTPIWSIETCSTPIVVSRRVNGMIAKGCNNVERSPRNCLLVCVLYGIGWDQSHPLLSTWAEWCILSSHMCRSNYLSAEFHVIHEQGMLMTSLSNLAWGRILRAT